MMARSNIVDYCWMLVFDANGWHRGRGFLPPGQRLPLIYSSYGGAETRSSLESPHDMQQYTNSSLSILTDSGGQFNSRSGKSSPVSLTLQSTQGLKDIQVMCLSGATFISMA